ncbi:MAG: sodium:solute symporter [Phycisphaerae bacterium]|nr:sodium:solute symporter [Phycisphaerae bacterium]
MLTESTFTTLDWAVLIVYFSCTMAIGFYFYRRSRCTEGFMAARRSLPGWACGLSIFATYLSSISFLALPGKSFASNWNPFVFSLSLPPAVWIAVHFFMPYYRRTNEVSAYAHLERRFGPWARAYVSFFYILTQLARMGVVMYLMALPLSILLRQNILIIILLTGLSVTIYAFVGGIIAVIWADALQAVVLIGGAVVCCLLMLFKMPEGPQQIFALAAEHDKFSLGSFGMSLAQPTFWVVLVYGIVINLQNFGIDQSYIQRYIASGSDKEARKSIWLGGLLYLPVSAMFFFIGTQLFAFYDAHPQHMQQARTTVAEMQLLRQGISPESSTFDAHRREIAWQLTDSEIGDKVFAHFIGRMLPAGAKGLLIAALFAAGMSTVSTSLNSSATLLAKDWYQRFIRPAAGEHAMMRALYASTVLWGILGTGVALFLTRTSENILDVWWLLAGILGGGMLGLFLLGMISRRANNSIALTAVLLGLIVLGWMSLSARIPGCPEALQSPFHGFLVPVFGTLTILLAGLLLCVILRPPPAARA